MLKVVAHYMDGRIEFAPFDSPARPTCLHPRAERAIGHRGVSDSRACSSSGTTRGGPITRKLKNVNPGDPRGRGARWLEMTFMDGEVMVGLSTNYSEELPVFAVVPTDTKSNNTRIIVNRGALKSLRILRPA